MHADPFAGNSKLLVSSSRDALIRFPPSSSASYRGAFLFHLSRSSLFLRRLFIRALFAGMASIFATLFLSPNLSQPVCRPSNSPSSLFAEGSSLRFGKSASKNDYSEINNNDITARRDRYVRKWFSPADLDFPGL